MQCVPSPYSPSPEKEGKEEERREREGRKEGWWLEEINLRRGGGMDRHGGGWVVTVVGEREGKAGPGSMWLYDQPCLHCGPMTMCGNVCVTENGCGVAMCVPCVASNCVASCLLSSSLPLPFFFLPSLHSCYPLRRQGEAGSGSEQGELTAAGRLERTDQQGRGTDRPQDPLTTPHRPPFSHSSVQLWPLTAGEELSWYSCSFSSPLRRRGSVLSRKKELDWRRNSLEMIHY